MSDIGSLIEKFLNIELVQQYPGDPSELRERWFYMRAREGQLDLTTASSEELRSTMPKTDTVLRGDERRICLRASYRKKFDDATRKWITDYDLIRLDLVHSCMLSEVDRKWHDDNGFIKKIVHKRTHMLPSSDSDLILLTRHEIKKINSCLERAIEYEKANTRMVCQVMAQANKEDSQSPLNRIPNNLKALIAGFLGSSVVHDDLERTQYALQFLNTPQPSGAGADPKPDDDMRLSATTIQKT